MTLTVELDDLRNSICDSCKQNVSYSNSSAPLIAISASQDSAGRAAPVSTPLGRRLFPGRQRTDNALSIRPSHSPAASPNTLLAPFEPKVAHNLPTTPTPTNPGPEKKPTPPEWSLVYNPEVEQNLGLHLAHFFTFDSSVHCIHMSPDGQRLAVGLAGNGKTHLYEMETGSNIRLVSEPLVKYWIDVIDPSVFVDRYVNVKDRITIFSVKFSPNGQLLATGASDNRIRVCSQNVNLYQAHPTLPRYGILPQNECEPCSNETKTKPTPSPSLLMVVLLSLHPTGPFAYGTYAMDHRRPCR